LQVVRQDFIGQGQAAGVGGAPTPPVPGQNILGILPGKTDRLIVFGAHYDSAVSAYGAAYDDGSGTIILTELARAMARYDWVHTLVFAEFDQEESGLVGSAAYAQQLLDEGRQVDLMINFDMAGINWPAKIGGTVDEPITAAFSLTGANNNSALWTQVVEHLEHPANSSEVTADEAAAGGGPSDHGSFIAAGFPSAWVHGALIGTYPAYHTGDQVATMIADVGGDRAALEAGFDAIMLRTFVFTFAIDGMTVA
jgi:Zn-dependent M28 family amino/carboxypeptidase